MYIDGDEWSDSIQHLAQFVLEAVSQLDDTDTDTNYSLLPRVIANIGAAAFTVAEELLRADGWQRAQAQAYFLQLVAEPYQSFYVVHSDNALQPGGIARSFLDLDSWYNEIETTIMPSRARSLLLEYGDEVDAETREHWKRLAHEGEDPNATAD